MHIHATAATPAGDSLAGFEAAQTANALRRARDLSDAAARLKARSLSGGIDDDTASFASLMAANPPAQSLSIAQAVGSVDARHTEKESISTPQVDSASTVQETESRSARLSSTNPESSGSEPLRGSRMGLGQPDSYLGGKNASGTGGLNATSNDWLRPVSFWA
jgi:hypothetical protein